MGVPTQQKEFFYMGVPRSQRNIKTEFYPLYIEPKNLSLKKAHTIITNMLIKTDAHLFDQCVVYAEMLGEMRREGTIFDIPLGDRDVECKRYLLEELNLKSLGVANQTKLNHDAASTHTPGEQSFQPPDFLVDNSIVIAVGSQEFLAVAADMVMERQGSLVQKLIYTLGCIPFLKKEGQYISPITLDTRYSNFDPGCVNFLQHYQSQRRRSHDSIMQEFAEKN